MLWEEVVSFSALKADVRVWVGRTAGVLSAKQSIIAKDRSRKFNCHCEMLLLPYKLAITKLCLRDNKRFMRKYIASKLLFMLSPPNSRCESRNAIKLALKLSRFLFSVFIASMTWQTFSPPACWHILTSILNGVDCISSEWRLENISISRFSIFPCFQFRSLFPEFIPALLLIVLPSPSSIFLQLNKIETSRHHFLFRLRKGSLIINKNSMKWKFIPRHK